MGQWFSIDGMTLTVLGQHPAFFFWFKNLLFSLWLEFNWLCWLQSFSLFFYFQCAVHTDFYFLTGGAKLQYNHIVISHQGSPLCLSVLSPGGCATSQACWHHLTTPGTCTLLSKGGWYRETLNKLRPRGEKLLAPKTIGKGVDMITNASPLLID